MKKPFTQALASLLLFCLLGVQQVAAQITVEATDMPLLNDTLRFSTSATSVTALVNQSGANQTWVASNLVPNFQDIARFRSATSINFLYVGSFGTSTYGTASTQALNLGLVQGSDAYTFYRRTGSAFIIDGRGFSVQSIPLSQTWKDTVYRFPLTYGNKDSNSYITNEVNALVATITGTGKRVNTVDGWGSITTPFGTFDCIRVKSVVRTTDTIRTSFLPIPFPISQVYTEYKWIAKNQKIPVLEVVVPQSGVQTTVRYRDIARPEAFTNLARFTLNKTTFQSGSNIDTCLLTDNSTRNPIARNWTITPNTFQFTGGTDATSQRPKVFFTAPGVYTVSLRVSYDAGSDDTTRVDVITVGEGPTANFVADQTNTNTSAIVQFTDSSLGTPVSWKWSFNPSTVSFVGGTTEASQNPKVIFDAPGVYDVSLEVENAFGTDVMTKTSYISSFNTGLYNTMEPVVLALYPNPANNKLIVETDAIVLNVLLMDCNGREITQSITGNELDVSQIPSGLYAVVVTTSQGQVTRKVLIQH